MWTQEMDATVGLVGHDAHVPELLGLGRLNDGRLRRGSRHPGVLEPTLHGERKGGTGVLGHTQLNLHRRSPDGAIWPEHAQTRTQRGPPQHTHTLPHWNPAPQ